MGESRGRAAALPVIGAWPRAAGRSTAPPAPSLIPFPARSPRAVCWEAQCGLSQHGKHRLSAGGSERAPLATSHLGDRAQPEVSIPFFPKKRKSAPPCSLSKRPAGVVCVVTEDRDRVCDLASSMWGDASHAWPAPNFWAPWGHGQGTRSGSVSPGSQSSLRFWGPWSCGSLCFGHSLVATLRVVP